MRSPSFLSGWQDSNLHDRGPKPRGQPLTHTQSVPSARLERASQRFKGADPALDHEGQCRWGDRRGSNPHRRVHRAPCRATTPRPPHAPGPGPLDHPGSVGAGGVEPRVGRLSCGCTSVVLRTFVFRTLKGFRTSRDVLESAEPPLAHAIIGAPSGSRTTPSGSSGQRSSPRELPGQRRDWLPAAMFSSSIVREHERSDRSGGSAGNRTPFARVRTECLAIKASDPGPDGLLPSVGLEPTQSGLKGRCPARWASAAQLCRRRVFFRGSGRTRTCAWACAQTGLRPASFATRMHAPRWGSRNSFPIP